MPLTRQQKETRVSEVGDTMSGATSAVFLAYDKLNVVDVNELRTKLYEAGCEMRVVPKRLLSIALSGAKLTFNPMEHEGQMAVITGKDGVSPAKVLFAFAKGKANLRLVAGLLEGKEISSSDISALAALPGRQELLGQLAGVLAGPMRGMAQVLSGVPRATVLVLQAIADQKIKS
ncbi:MAG: 50S ribosomal protein L10 [bacterium]|nr:50S ribosomal protein L10 [bacterium]